MSINGMKQQQGEKRADFIARCQAAQREAATARNPYAGHPVPRGILGKASVKPAYGSQQWAETRGDDLGESPDY